MTRFACIFGMQVLYSEFGRPAKTSRISNLCRLIFKLWQLNYMWSTSD